MARKGALRRRAEILLALPCAERVSVISPPRLGPLAGWSAPAGEPTRSKGRWGPPPQHLGLERGWPHPRGGMHEQTDYDILLLEEMHWRFTNSWMLPKYHIFHAGTSDHRYQLPGMPRRHSKNPVRFVVARSTPLAGHILHVRNPVNGQDVGVSTVYQHALPS